MSKPTGEERFYIEHGFIHDRATGKHVTTDEDSWVTPEGTTMPNPHGSGVTATCALLNELASQRQPHPMAGELEAHKLDLWANHLATGVFTGSELDEITSWLRATAQLKRDGR